MRISSQIKWRRLLIALGGTVFASTLAKADQAKPENEFTHRIKRVQVSILYKLPGLKLATNNLPRNEGWSNGNGVWDNGAGPGGDAGWSNGNGVWDNATDNGWSNGNGVWDNGSTGGEDAGWSNGNGVWDNATDNGWSNGNGVWDNGSTGGEDAGWSNGNGVWDNATDNGWSNGNGVWENGSAAHHAEAPKPTKPTFLKG